MARAFKCDRCGKFYTIICTDYYKRPSDMGRKTFGLRTMGINNDFDLRSYDLCIECAIELEEFLNGPKRGEDE